jgi:beta-lactamase class D
MDCKHMPSVSSSPRTLDRRRFLALCAKLSALLAAPAAAARAWAGDVEERANLKPLFEAEGVVGTFVLHDPVAGRTITVDGERAARRYVPASTFKIANSLIALETGVVKDESEIIPYGGKPQPFKAWEKDMSMREAIAASAVPIYQEIARRVGLERYGDWLQRLDYGNRRTDAALETFWLDGPLEISAVEQARFVTALAQQKLPASARSQGIVRDILRLESSGGRTLYGKTGWRISSTPQLGWWTGWVEHGSKLAAFSLNIDMPSPEDVRKRVPLGKAILAKLEVL